MRPTYLVVIGASAGGFAALKELVSRLPGDLPAAVCVVLHTAPTFSSTLPEILSRTGPLPAVHATQGKVLNAGCILVAPPDHHLLVRADHVELSRGPRENHARPAVDVSLRTASRAFGSRIAGVVLSGMLGDGTMGLMAVKARGGLAIVQDPEEASYSSMPEHAMRYVDVDYVLPVREIASLLSLHARQMADRSEETNMQDNDLPLQHAIQRDFKNQVAGERRAEESIYTCPECSGILWQSQEDDVTGFRCYQGHSYAPERLLLDKSEALETALWSAARALVERATLNRQLAAQLRGRGLQDRARALEEQAELDERHVVLLRRDLLQAEGGLPCLGVSPRRPARPDRRGTPVTVAFTHHPCDRAAPDFRRRSWRMYYSFETVAGMFLLQRQPFTHGAWELSFNGAFVDSFASPVQGAEGTCSHALRLGITDTLQLPPPSLSGWEIHWCAQHTGEAAEVWLHSLYLQGMRPTSQRKADPHPLPTPLPVT